MDRNTNFFPAGLFDLPSLSARRAWIEILIFDGAGQLIKSLSARRAWIEIKHVVKDSDFSGSRSPQGERG